MEAKTTGGQTLREGSRLNQQAFREGVALFTILAILLSIWVQGPIAFTLPEDLDIKLYDVILPFLLLIWIFYALSNGVKLNRYFLISLFFIFIFSAWIIFQFFRSPQPLRAFTEVIIFLRDLLIFFTVGTLVAELRDLNRLTRWIFYISLGLSSVAIMLYLFFLPGYVEILASPERWYPKIGYWADVGGMIRLGGLIGHPVRYSCYMILGLFCGMAGQNIPRWLKYFGLFVICVTLFLTFTRGLLIALPISILILIIFGVSTRALTAYFSPLVVVGVAIFLLSLIPLPLYGQSGLSLMASRFGRVETDPRLYLWGKTISVIDNPVLGAGLRASEHALSAEKERFRWLDNSYLVLLTDTGFIGLVVFLWIFVPLIVRGLKRTLRDALLPYTHCVITLLLLFFFYFLIYEPFLWLVSGIAAGAVSHTAHLGTTDRSVD